MRDFSVISDKIGAKAALNAQDGLSFTGGADILCPPGLCP
jgi:hypothetical protein